MLTEPAPARIRVHGEVLRHELGGTRGIRTDLYGTNGTDNTPLQHGDKDRPASFGLHLTVEEGEAVCRHGLGEGGEGAADVGWASR